MAKKRCTTQQYRAEVQAGQLRDPHSRDVMRTADMGGANDLSFDETNTVQKKKNSLLSNEFGEAVRKTDLVASKNMSFNATRNRARTINAETPRSIKEKIVLSSSFVEKTGVNPSNSSAH